MVIGIGTGISAGVLTSAQRVSQVDVVEISDAVIGSIDSMSPENLSFHKSHKTTIHKSDAFQLLKAVKDRYHMMISEPPNPWVVGVENLYTPYFYKLAKGRLTKDGIFVQWIHTYSISKEILTTILSNLKDTFKNVTLFRVSRGDIAFFASNRPVPFKINSQNVIVSKDLPEKSNKDIAKTSSHPISSTHVSKVSIEPLVRKILDNIHVEKVSDLNFYELYNSQEIDAIIETNLSFPHEIFYPTLNKESYFYFYTGNTVNIYQLLDPMYKRIIGRQSQSLARKERLKKIINTDECKKETTYIHFPCAFLVKPYALPSTFKNIESSSVKKRVLAYSTLRDLGLIKKDITFIKKAISNLPPLTKKKSVLSTSTLVT